MQELGLTTAQLAEKAEVSERTIRRLLAGHQTRDDTLERVAVALGWPAGEFTRRGSGCTLALSEVPTAELVQELCGRFAGHETHRPDTSGPRD